MWLCDNYEILPIIMTKIAHLSGRNELPYILDTSSCFRIYSILEVHIKPCDIQTISHVATGL